MYLLDGAVTAIVLTGGIFDGRNPVLSRLRSGHAGCTSVTPIDHLQERDKNVAQEWHVQIPFCVLLDELLKSLKSVVHCSLAWLP